MACVHRNTHKINKGAESFLKSKRMRRKPSKAKQMTSENVEFREKKERRKYEYEYDLRAVTLHV